MATTKISTTTTTTTIESTDGAPLALLPELTIIEGHAFCTSLQIAEHFDKEHFHVIRDIETAIAQIAESGETAGEMFQRGEYEIMAGFGKVKKPMYLMNRDGFSLLVMGYTGAKAMKFKLSYIAAFNRMEEVLKAGILQSQPKQQYISSAQYRVIRDAVNDMARKFWMENSIADRMRNSIRFKLNVESVAKIPVEKYQQALDIVKEMHARLYDKGLSGFMIEQQYELVTRFICDGEPLTANIMKELNKRADRILPTPKNWAQAAVQLGMES